MKWFTAKPQRTRRGAKEEEVGFEKWDRNAELAEVAEGCAEEEVAFIGRDASPLYRPGT